MLTEFIGTEAVMHPVAPPVEIEAVFLPPPALPPVTLRDALASRRSTRTLSSDALDIGILSALLWAAAGCNRTDGGRRTAPSPYGWYGIDVHAVEAAGVRRYEATEHCLRHVASGDLRAHTGLQDFVGSAALNLVYVADLDSMKDVPECDRAFLASASAGAMVQNVYLCCAAFGLGAVVRTTIDHRHLAEALHLAPDRRILMAQSVGRIVGDGQKA
jgi:nitroreductase